jgi:hypothetical protein
VHLVGFRYKIRISPYGHATKMNYRSLNETVQVTCQHFVPWPQSNTMSLRARALLSSMCTAAAHCVTSSFRREVYENCLLLGYYAASSVNSFSSFRENLSVRYSRLKNASRPLQMRPLFYILFEIKLIPTFFWFWVRGINRSEFRLVFIVCYIHDTYVHCI